jgi:hypothetical protein
MRVLGATHRVHFGHLNQPLASKMLESPGPPELTQTSPGALEADKASGAFFMQSMFTRSSTI